MGSGPIGAHPTATAMEHSPALTRGPGAWRPATGAGSVPTRRPFMVCPNGVYSLYILIYIYIHIFMYTVLKEILFYWEDDESDHESLGLDSL